MKLEPSHSQPRHRSRKSEIVALITLAAYALVICVLAVVFYKLLLNKMWLVPVLAEAVLVRSAWTFAPWWKAVTGRAVALAIGNALAYFLYIIPLVYEGQEPWSEETLWVWLTAAVQVPVAAVARLVSRRLFPCKPGSD